MEFAESFWEQFTNKKVVCYGADASGLTFVYMAQKAGVDIAYFVDRNKEKYNLLLMGKKIKAPVELMYEDYDKLKIVITAPGMEDQIIRTLNELGFEQGKQIVDEYSVKMSALSESSVDAVLGTSRGDHILYEMKEKSADNEILILITGGSTSDPMLAGLHSWSYYLQKLIDENGICGRVINIAEAGYASGQELLSLIRDGLSVKPNVVISYSGWNDVTPAMDIEDGKRYPYTSRETVLAFKSLLDSYRKEKTFPDVYYGKLDGNPYERYITNMRLMHAICAEFGFAFYGFLQPSLASIPEKMLTSDFAKCVSRDALMVDMKRRWNIFYDRYRKDLFKYAYLFDLTGILNGHDDVFRDTCHVNEQGNEIIAKSIFESLCEQSIF